MNTLIYCPIWRAPVTDFTDYHFMSYYESPRADGGYAVLLEARFELRSRRVKAETRALLTTWLMDQRRSGVETPVLLLDSIEHARKATPLSSEERLTKLLLYYETLTDFPGDAIPDYAVKDLSERDSMFRDCVLAHIESSRGPHAFRQIINEIKSYNSRLVKRGYLVRDPDWPDRKQDAAVSYKITPAGFDRLADLRRANITLG
ncbi:MAG: hypothetical protein OXB95_03825 [Rhodobacteraceae bacterium]|nr:hypothetical protein [Paracoccaceae bacterium]